MAAHVLVVATATATSDDLMAALQERVARGPVDFLLLDARKEDYLDYLKAVEPRLVKGALIIADNTGIYRREVKPYLAHVRGGAPYTSREYDFGFDCMEVSVHRG